MKNKFIRKSRIKTMLLFIVMALLAILPAALAQPALGIATAGKQSVLYWSTTPTSYLLESSTNLASPNWVIAHDAMPVSAVVVTNTLPARFFQLVYINPLAESLTGGGELNGESSDIPASNYRSVSGVDPNHRTNSATMPVAAIPTQANPMRLISAVYGSGTKFADVTDRVNNLLKKESVQFFAHPNWLGADPTPGWNKELVIIYEFKGCRHIFMAGEGGAVSAEVLIQQAMQG